MLVPDGAPTINAAINAAGHDGVVLVRPGLYSESVRVTRDLTLCGLGPLGSVVVQPPGWEAAFVWGGYSVGQATVGTTVHQAASAGLALTPTPTPTLTVTLTLTLTLTVHQAASAGAHARVRNVAVRLRNQQQQTPTLTLTLTLTLSLTLTLTPTPILTGATCDGATRAGAAAAA